MKFFKKYTHHALICRMIILTIAATQVCFLSSAEASKRKRKQRSQVAPSIPASSPGSSLAGGPDSRPTSSPTTSPDSRPTSSLTASPDSIPASSLDSLAASPIDRQSLPVVDVTASLRYPVPSAEGVDPFGRPPSSLTLQKCIQIAIDGSTSVLKAENDQTAQGAQLLQAYAQFLPNLGVQASYAYQSGLIYFATASPTLINTKNVSAGYTINSTLNIFNGLGDFSALKSSLGKKDAADLTTARAKQQIALDVSQSYLQVILDQQIILIAKKNLSSSLARQRLLEEQTRVGARNLSDLFRQQAQTSADELYLTNSQNKERTDQLLLLRKLRLELDRSYRLEEPKLEENPTIATQYTNEAELIQKGLAQRSDFLASQKLSDSSQWDVQTARSAYYPRLDLGFSLLSNARYLEQQVVNGVNTVPSSQNTFGYQLGTQVNYVAGLTLTWNIFDRLTTRANVANVRRNSNNLEVDLGDRQRQVIGEIRQAYGDYHASLQQVESTRSGLNAAQKAFEVMQGRYEVGSASFIDLVTSQAALVQAEASRAQAVIGFALQTRAMNNALGITVQD